MIHCTEPRQVLAPSPNPHKAQLDVRCFPEQMAQSAHGPSGVALSGKMPENCSAPRIETPCTCGFHKPGFGLIARGSEIEGFVEFAGAGQFGSARGQAGILGNLAKAHVMETRNPHGAFLRDVVESLADFRIGPALRDAKIARRAHGVRNPQAKVAVGEEDPSAIFCYERVDMPKLSPEGLDLFPCARSQQNEGDFSPFEFRQRFFRA